MIYYIERCPRRRPFGGISQGYLLSPICPTVNHCNEWKTRLMQEQNHTQTTTGRQLRPSTRRAQEGYLQAIPRNIHLEGKGLEWLKSQDERESDGVKLRHLLRCCPSSALHFHGQKRQRKMWSGPGVSPVSRRAQHVWRNSGLESGD